MLLLALFAFVAGAATAVSPCVLPVLPALLAAGAAGGRRRPLGIVLGLALTFTVTIVGLAKVLNGVGLGNSITRDIAIAVLAAAGLALLIPALAARLEAPLSRLARWGPKSTGDGFWSGLGVGAALGFVYAPCAGPILAAVITVSAASGRTVVVGAAYAIGSAVVLLVLALGGRRVLAPLRRSRRGPTLQRAIGAVMALTALAMALQLDVRFQESLARNLPDALVNPTAGLEKSDAVQDRLADLRGRSRFEERAEAAAKTPPAAGAEVSELPRLGAAPEFVDNQRWFNTPGEKPLTLAGLRGRVVLIDFWTYTCINCIRTLPYLKAWDARYRSQGLTIVGVHAPEFSFEKDAGNVERAIKADGLRYPVVQDNNLSTWQAWANQAWPAKYLVDASGQVRYVHIGEGEYDETEASIRALLAEAGSKGLGARAQPKDVVTPSHEEITPETYVGVERSERFLAKIEEGRHTYVATPAEALPLSHFTLGGTWDAGPQASTAVQSATLTARVRGKDIYVVLAPPPEHERRPYPIGRVELEIDGRPVRTLAVKTQRLYTLARRAKPDLHVVTLRVSPGVSVYAFTFG